MINTINTLFDNLFNTHQLIINFKGFEIVNLDYGIFISNCLIIACIVFISMFILKLIKK